MRTFCAALLFALLAACGQTGDLYLPNKTPPTSAQIDKDKKKEPPPAEPTITQPAPPQPN